MSARRDTFTDVLAPYWQRHLVGRGTVQLHAGALRLQTSDAVASAYSDAQIDDYGGLARRALPWQPPLTLSVRARFSHPAGVLRGTAGFGFWNDPFLLTGRKLPTLPRAIWFFYASPPSNMKLDLLMAGNGWKAATIDAWRWPFLLLAPTAPLACLLMRSAPLYRALWPIGQAALGVREATITSAMTDWHTYRLSWSRHGARFAVDGADVLVSGMATRGPLGFVAWLDNQYAVVTPQGVFGSGLLDASGEQWLEIESLEIEPES